MNEPVGINLKKFITPLFINPIELNDPNDQMKTPESPEDAPLPNQDAIVETLKNLGISFNQNPSKEQVFPLDPDKFYAVFINGPTADSKTIDLLGKYFKKGGILFLNKKDETIGYSIEDLRAIREGVSVLLEMAEKNYKVSCSRFDIIRGGV